MKVKFLILLLTIGGLFTMGFTNPAVTQQTFQIEDDQSYPLENVESIQISMSSEAIRVYQAPAGNEVRFHYYGWSIPERHMSIEKVGDKITVESDYWFRIGILHLDVYLPADYANTLTINSASGSVTVEPLSLSNLSVKTASGRFTADSIIASNVSLRSSSGLIEVNSLDAAQTEISNSSGGVRVANTRVKDGVVKTASGGINLKNIDGNLKVTSVSGGVTLEYARFEGNTLACSNTSGSITVWLPASAEFILTTRTTSGRVTSEFANGDGPASIQLSTVSSGIKVLKTQ